MPELVEVERYRQAADQVMGCAIEAVEVPDPHVLGGRLTPRQLRAALKGRAFTAARRHGKLLLLDTGPRPGEPAEAGPTLGLRFGMTGGLVVTGTAVIDRLLYSSRQFGEQWLRFCLRLEGGRELALHDPRRFGRVLLDPDESALGPDAATVTLGQLGQALAARWGEGPPLKARLMDQARLAGLGNLLVDEILWRAGLAPGRPSASLSQAERRRLHRHLRATVAELQRLGGSHLGALTDERRSGGLCRRDGAPLRRSTVGGRTTWWCPAHQH